MEKLSKTIYGAMVYVFTYLLKMFNEIFIILSLLMMFDYVMGIIQAIKNDTINCKVGIWGIIKKLLYIMILATGYLVDYLINYLIKQIGLDFQTYGSFGFVVMFYLLGNEGISLCKHWSNIGLPVPKSLIYIFEKFKLIAKENEMETKNKKEE